MKLKKFFVIALALVLVAGLMIPTASVSAKDMAWGKEVIIQEGTFSAPTKLALQGSDVLDMVAAPTDGKLWAIVQDEGTPASYLYRSTNAAASWAKRSPAGTDLTVVAVSLDDSQVVVAAGTTPGTATKAYLTSENGESGTWTDIGDSSAGGNLNASFGVNGTIQCIAISPKDGDGYRWMAVGGDDGAGNAALAVGKMAALGGWDDYTALASWPMGQDAIVALAFSPKFRYDSALVTINAGSSTTLNYIECDVPQVNDPDGYPVELSAVDAVTADISLIDTFYGLDDTERIAYVAWDTGSASSSGVSRVDDIAEEEMLTGLYSTVAYNGDTNQLIIGSTSSGLVRISNNPDTTSPSFASPPSLQRASGDAVSACAWSGSTMVASTIGDESGIFTGSANGKSWHGKSLLDTDLDNMTDIVISEDGTVIYIAATDGNNCNIYRKSGGSWLRVFSEDMGGPNDIIVRTAPGKPESLFIGWVGQKEVRYSHDSGVTWKRTESDVNLKDMVAKSDQIVFHMASNGYVSTSKDGGATFVDWVKSNVSGDQIIIEPTTGDVIVIGASEGHGRGAISSNDGDTFSRTPAALGIADSGSPFFIAAATTYDTTNLIFVAQDQTVQRWEVGGTMEDWKDCTSSSTYPIGGTDEITGIGFHGGSLYVMYNDPGVSSGFARSADWGGRTPTWADQNETGVDFARLPTALKFSTGSTKVSALNTAPTTQDELWSFTDVVQAVIAPSVTAPAEGYVGSVDVELDKIDPIRFAWGEVHEYARYDLRLGTNSAVSANYVTFDAGNKEWITIGDGPDSAANKLYSFVVGETYYWKTRVREPVTGPWSAISSFSIEVPERTTPAILLTPDNGASGISRNPAFSWQPVAGVSEYTFLIAGNSLLANPVAEATKLKVPAYRVVTNLEYGKTYFWRVTPTKPAGESSPVFNFTVMAEPVVPPPVVEAPESFICPQCGLEFFNQQDLAKHWAEFHAPIPTAPPPPPTPPITPSWVWIVVGIGAALVIATLVLIVTTRRPPAP